LHTITIYSFQFIVKEKEKEKSHVPGGNPWKARERKESDQFTCGN
jgi:hypothetical protein